MQPQTPSDFFGGAKLIKFGQIWLGEIWAIFRQIWAKFGQK